MKIKSQLVCFKEVFKKNDKNKNNIKRYDEKSQVERYKIGEPTKYEFEIIKNFEKGKKVLDVGCGAGRIDFWLAKKGFKIVGIDISQGMIDSANEFLRESKYKKDIRFQQGNALSLNFKDNTFDYVISLFNLPTLLDSNEVRKKEIKEMIRVCKKNGKIMITLSNRNNSKIWIKSLVYYILFLASGKKADFGDMYSLDENSETPLFQHMLSENDIRNYLKNEIENGEVKINMLYANKYGIQKGKVKNPTFIALIEKIK